MRSARRRWSWRVKGRNAVMPTIERVSDKPYRYRIGVAALAQGRQRREVHAARLHPRDGFGITEACKRYLRPLIQGEDYSAYGKDGLPLT